MPSFLPRFLSRSVPLAGLAAAAMILTSSSPAHASGDGAIVLVEIALFDVISLPADIYMAANHEKVPSGWAFGEAIGGGLQMTGGAIGVGYCLNNIKCRNGWEMPALGVFTAWTTAMTVHGIVSLATTPRSSYAAALKPPPFSIVPMVGDGRSTPAGVGVTGTF